MPPHLPLWVLTLLLVTGGVNGAFDTFELEAGLYDISIGDKPLSEQKIAEETQNDDVVSLTSIHGQPFACKLPQPPRPLVDSSINSSPNPATAAEIIAANLRNCLNLPAGWWTYTFCRGRHVLQQHGKQEDPAHVVNTLGIYAGRHSIPSDLTRSTKDAMLYLQERYEMGSVCDLTGKARTANVRYICDPTLTLTESEFYSIEEVASCEYVLIIRVGSLCALPQFAPPKTEPVRMIHCSPVITDTNAEALNAAQKKKKETKKKAADEQAKVKEEMNRLQLRRWSLERRRLEREEEVFNENMRQLDDDYVELLRSSMVWSLYERLGDDPSNESLDAIDDVVDAMQEINTIRIPYPTVADEDRANVFYYFHNSEWRQDGFPLPLDEVDMLNGYYLRMKETKSLATKMEQQALMEITVSTHPSKLEAMVYYLDPEYLQDVIQLLIAEYWYIISPGKTLLSLPEFFNHISKERERTFMINSYKERIAEIMMKEEIVVQKYCDNVMTVLQSAYAGIRIMETLPHMKKKPTDRRKAIVDYFARIAHETYKASFTRKMIPLERDLKAAKATGVAPDTIKKVTADFKKMKEMVAELEDFDEFLEEMRGGRRDIYERYFPKVEEGTQNIIESVTRAAFRKHRPILIAEGRRYFEDAHPKDLDGVEGHGLVRLSNEVDGEFMTKLYSLISGTNAVVLKVHPRGAQLSKADTKLLEAMVEQELADAREREKGRERKKAYSYLFNSDA